MKKITYLIAAIAIFAATTANAQVKFGFKGGLNVTNMSISDDLLDASNRTGFFIGPTVKFTLPLVGLGIDASALYDQRSAKLTEDGSNDKKTVMQQSVAIPVNLRYGVGLGSLANVFAFAGPQWNLNIGDENFKWTNGSSYSLRKSTFSVNLGLGATVASHLQATVNYNIACGKTADVTVHEALNTVYNRKQSHNNSWQIALAYFF